MEWFIKLHRGLLKWEWYDDINTKVLFIHILLKANHTDKQWRGIDIKRWELLTWLNVLSSETWLSIQQIRTCYKKLKSTNEITIKTTNNYSIIKLINYNLYQDNNKQITNEQQTDNKRVTTTNELKNVKNITITPPKKQVFQEDSFEYSISKYFLDKTSSNPTVAYQIKDRWYETVIQSYADEARKLINIDKLTEEQLKTIIDFVLQDDFWNKQILSMWKLRAKNKEKIPYYLVMIDKLKHKRDEFVENKRVNAWVEVSQEILDQLI